MIALLLVCFHRPAHTQKVTLK